jgi:hypothetical protein
MFLYKFLPVCVYDRGTKAPRMWTYELLAKRKLFLGAPLNFNDPYDCMVTSDLAGREEQLADFIAANHSPPPTPADRKRAMEMMRNDASFRQMLEADAREELERRQAVYCFAADSEAVPAFGNLLMWGHYADNFRGICLEFDLERLQDTFAIGRVTYSKHCRPINVFDVLLSNDDDMPRRLADWVLTKADCWSYENEWRIYAEGVGPRDYPSDCLTKVFLGSRMPGDDEAMIRRWVAELDPAPQVFRTSLRSNEYSIATSIG